MENEIKISPASPDDVRGVQEVFYRTWLATYPNKEAGITVEDIEYMYKDAFSEEVLLKRAERMTHLPNGTKFFMAKEGGKVVGVCTAVRREDKNQLQAIYVLPEYQGKGIGSMLWREAQKFFDPTKETIVQVADYNLGAIEFYKKLGFVDSGKPHWNSDKFKMKSGAMITEIEMTLR
jgi:GNAT superfamily N-acetyltransferase